MDRRVIQVASLCFSLVKEQTVNVFFIVFVHNLCRSMFDRCMCTLCMPLCVSTLKSLQCNCALFLVYLFFFNRFVYSELFFKILKKTLESYLMNCNLQHFGNISATFQTCSSTLLRTERLSDRKNQQKTSRKSMILNH